MGEYSEVSKEVQKATLEFPWGNTGIFSATMEFVERVASVELPYHLAHKEMTRAYLEGESWNSVKEWVYKFETFIIDIFPYANMFKILASDREKHFAPLKNREGEDSFKTVLEAIDKYRNL